MFKNKNNLEISISHYSNVNNHYVYFVDVYDGELNESKYTHFIIDVIDDKPWIIAMYRFDGSVNVVNLIAGQPILIRDLDIAELVYYYNLFSVLR